MTTAALTTEEARSVVLDFLRPRDWVDMPELIDHLRGLERHRPQSEILGDRRDDLLRCL
jgi:hypothetical protein